MKRRFTLLAIATFLSGTLMAQWDGTTPASLTFSGDGTEANPYKISSEAELAYLAKTVNAGTNYATKFFKQTADLDLANKTWTPIGNNSKQFSGTYDGNGFVINNLYYSDSSAQYVGLFGGINNATLKNITLASGFVYGYQYAGGICGIAKGESTITCCANIATVYGKMERIGGVVAQIDGTTDVNNCINYGLISAYNFAGGVVGGRNKSYNQTVSHCINVGQVFTMRSSGNLYGMNNNGYGTTKCYYDNQINASGGWTFNGSSKETEDDKTGEMEGLSTLEMTSESLDGFSNSIWLFTPGMYPRLQVSSGKDAIVLAATPIILTSSDKADNVTKDFTISSEWTSGNTNNLSISNGVANIKKSTAVVLIATKGNYTKKVYLKTNKNGATAIGSAASPLTIESEDELIRFREAVNNYGIYKGCANYDGFRGIHFKVTVDIELSDWTTPIGTHNSFKGVFDGNHRSIKNVNVDQYSKNIAIVGGLFGCASYGEIKNIAITSGTVSGIQFVGGLCGSVFRETIKNCSTNCVVSTSTKNNVGGVIGVSKGYSRYEGCINYGNVTGAQYVAGVIASCNTTDTVIRCKNYGEVSGTSNVAGICGNAAGTNCLYSFCENHNSITCSKATDPNSGGIISAGAGSGTIINCINTGNVTATGSNAGYCGGVIGHPSGSFSIDKCLNIGTITGNATGTIGGILGATDGTISIKNSYNAGIITGGGIVGSLKGTSTNCINVGKSTTSSNCVYDKQMCPVGSSGLLTNNMLGTELQSTLGTTDWTFTEGMYPMIKALENSDYMVVAATPIILNSSETPETINNVSKSFNYGKENGVEWTCNHPNIVSFVNGHDSYGKGYIANPASDLPVVDTVKKGDAKKIILMTILTKGVLTDPEVSWNLSPSTIDYGTAITEGMLNATTGKVCTGTWEYSVEVGDVLHAGDHVLTATFIPDDQETYEIKTTTANLHVNKGDASTFITWTPATSIKYGDEDSDSKLKNATASVEGSFTYTIPALTVGTHTIKLDFVGTNYKATIVKENALTVTAAKPSLAWSNPAPIEYGTAISSLQLSAVSGVEGDFDYYYKVANQTDDAYQAIVVGTELPINTYTLKAVFTPSSLNYESGTYKTVTLEVTKATPTITWSDPADITYGTALATGAGKQLNATANVSGSFAYVYNGQNAENAIPAAGNNQTISVTFTPTDQTHYTTASAEVHINVSKIQPTLTWNPDPITYGADETEINDNIKNASATFGVKEVTGTYDYTLPEQLTAGKKLASLVFTPTGDDANNFNGISIIGQEITINKADPEITWNPNGVTYGATTEEINTYIKTASAEFKGETVVGNYAYTIPSPLNAGIDIEIKLDFTPTGDYANNFNTVTNVTRTINVTQAEPSITWNMPEKITYGTTLTSAQLNATSVSGGTISYTVGSSSGDDAMNALLPAGDYVIYANITASGNYSETSIHKTLTVEQATPTITWSNPSDIVYGTVLSGTQLNAKVLIGDVEMKGTFAYTLSNNSNAMGAKLNAGNGQTLKVAFTPDANDNLAKNYKGNTKEVTINVIKATPTIDWTNPSDLVYGTELTKAILDAATSTDSDGAITYSTDEAGTANAVGTTPNAGDILIYVHIAETDNYSAKVEAKTLHIGKATPEITWTPQSITYGTTLKEGEHLNASATSNGTITYNIGTENGANAINALLEAGNNTIYVTVAETQNYNKKVEYRTLVVNQATPEITWDAPAGITYGTTLSDAQLNAQASVNGMYTYSPEAGTKLEAGNNQTLSVSFAPTDSKNYTTATASVTINVDQAKPVITWNTPADITYGTELSNSQLNATTNVNGLFSYSPAAGTILETGDDQTLTVNFNPTDTKNYTTATASVKINVAQAESEITWETPADIVYGDELTDAQLNAQSDVAGKFTYNPAKGTKLNAGSNQTLTVIFTPNDTKNYTSASAWVKINVAQAEPVITWDNPEDIIYGTELSGAQLNATSEVTGTFTYTPAEGTKLEAGDEQTLTVTFAPADTKNYTTASTSVKINVSQAEPEIVWNAPEDITYGTELSGAQLNASANVDGEFTYTPAEGTKLEAGSAQTLTATFAPTDTKNYTTATASVKINVAKAKPEIIWEPQTLTFTYGASEEEIESALTTASASFNGTPVNGEYEYTLPLPTDLQVGLDNIIAEVTFTPTGDDTTNFEPVTAILENIVVEKATPAITWTPIVSEITYGTALSGDQLNAESNVDGGFAYTPAADSILKVGTQTLSTVFTPADTNNYNSATAEVQINVTKAYPVITWETPEDITYGTALSDAQLNAEANVDGRFFYNPSTDVILSVGEQHKLTVMFMPTDIDNYISVSDTVYINVTADTTPVVIDTTAAIVWIPSAIDYGTPVGEIFNAETKVEGIISYSMPADTILNAGEYQIRATLSPIEGNDTTIARIVKVTKVGLTAAVANDTITQGDTMPEFGIVYNGFVSNDNAASLATAPTATCNVSTDTVGSFEIVVSGGEDINYNFEYINGLLTILAKADTLTPVDTLPNPIDTLPNPIDTLPIDTIIVASITWTPAVDTITYGTLIDSTILNAKADLEGRFEYSATKVEYFKGDTTVIDYALGDSVINEVNIVKPDTTYTTRSLAIGDTLTPGYYYLYATFYPTDSTVSIVRDTNSLLVNKAILEVTVEDVTIEQFDDVPESYEISYQGFVFGESKNDLIRIPEAKAQVSNADEAGTFDIRLLGGMSDNYEFDYHHGKLTIVAHEDTTAIAETEVMLMAYPNPTNGMFVVETNSNVEYIYVYNAVGKLVATEMNIGTTRFNLTNEPEGTYFVKVGEKTIKLMKF